MCRQLLFDRPRHVSSPFDVTNAQCFQAGIVSRITPKVASEGEAVADAAGGGNFDENMPKNMAIRRQIPAIS
ncbi:MAG: hypothetical protein ACREEK_27440 [Bradyrhizobium sp.]